MAALRPSPNRNVRAVGPNDVHNVPRWRISAHVGERKRADSEYSGPGMQYDILCGSRRSRRWVALRNQRVAQS